MVDVLEEVTSNTITKDHVERRVEDWAARIGDLYERVKQWLPDEWRVANVGETAMDEKMMQRFGIAPRTVPTLELVSQDGRAARFEPRGLWVVGINGRVDLFCGEKHFVLVDKSDAFEEPAWHIADFRERTENERLDKQPLVDALR